MYARVRELLTTEERLQYLKIPPDLSEWELGTTSRLHSMTLILLDNAEEITTV
jgi:hypothetical protein